MNSISIKILSVALFYCIVGQTLVKGYKQQLTLYESEESGNSFTFGSHVPDTSIYPLENITRICYIGHWTVYSRVGFSNEETIYHNGEWVCQDVKFPYKSFRHVAQKETTKDGLSLYTEMYWGGQETLTSDTLSSIPQMDGPVLSIALTGNSSWALYRGPNFTGGGVCIPKPTAQFEFDAYGNIDYLLGMTDIQSVRKNGC